MSRIFEREQTDRGALWEKLRDVAERCAERAHGRHAEPNGLGGLVATAVAARFQRRYRGKLRVAKAARKTAWRGVKVGTYPIRRPINTLGILAILIVFLLLFGLVTPSQLWNGAKQGGGMVIPSSYGCTAGPQPTGGIVGAAYTAGHAGWAFANWKPDPEKIDAAIVDGARHVGLAWGTFKSALQGGPEPVEDPGGVPPAQQVGAPVPCCGTGTVPAVYTPPAGPAAAGISEEQAANVRTMLGVAKGRGVPEYGQVIMLATARQESNLLNLGGGDRDSAGLFQQRPSQGWGSLAQVTDPVYATGKFLDALLAVPGWESLPVTVAAQAVQRSGFPYAYAQWEGLARNLVAAYGGAPVIAPASGPTCTPTIPAGLPGVPDGDLSGNAVAAKAAVLGEFGAMAVGGWGTRPNATEHDEMQDGRKASRALDFMTSDVAKGTAIADYLLANAAQLRVEYVIWNWRINTLDSRGWRPYSGASPHTDHVHLTVLPDGGGTPT